MTTPLTDPSCMLVILSSFSHGGETEKTPGKGQLPNAVPLNSLHRVPAPTLLPVSKVGATLMPVCLCDESPGCSIDKSISSYSCKFVLSKTYQVHGHQQWVTYLNISTADTQYYETSVFEIFFTISSFCSLTSDTSLAKVGGVACLLGSLRSLESQSDLCNTIHNGLTTHWKPNLR